MLLPSDQDRIDELEKQLAQAAQEKSDLVPCLSSAHSPRVVLVPFGWTHLSQWLDGLLDIGWYKNSIKLKILKLPQSLPMSSFKMSISNEYTLYIFWQFDNWNYEWMNELWTSGADSSKGQLRKVWFRKQCLEGWRPRLRPWAEIPWWKMHFDSLDSCIFIISWSKFSYRCLGRHCSEGGLQAWSMSHGRGQMIA